jgi:argininosuccinate synthase
MKRKKVILAFSGGLDTSFCAVYLKQELGYEVHAVTVNTGGFDKKELNKIEERAQSLGVASSIVLEESDVFYSRVIRYLIFGNVLKNQTYPLSVSAERIVQAIAIAKYARLMNADAIAHGSTGAGNDQVRFDMMFHVLCPELKIITPIRDLKLSREEEVDFLESKGIEIDGSKARYSINKGLWGTSVGGVETLTSNLELPAEAFPTKVTKTTAEDLVLGFVKGELKTINGSFYSDPVEAIQTLEKLAAPFGIGRDIHTGDTIIGIKGRVGFEAAAALLIIKAHHALEKHVLTKWQQYWKDNLSVWYGNWLHEGQFLDPVMRNIEKFMEETQCNVTGKVFLKLYPYHFSIAGSESPHDLMSDKFGSYGEMNNSWSGDDVKGFAKIFSNQTSIYHKVNSLSIHEK